MNDDDRQNALRQVPVSRETEARLTIYAGLLRRWQSITNLVAPATLPHVWLRHFADSAQLLERAPAARSWVDMGSGAGFPGLVIAMQLAECQTGHVHLIESDGRKCAFLRTVIRETGARASVIHARIETAIEALAKKADAEPIDAVTARALAPLAQLADYSQSLLTSGSMGVFPKGRNVDIELTAAVNLRNFHVDLVPSRTDPEGRIVIVRCLLAKDS